MGPHGTSRHGPFSGERRTDPPLDRTVVVHRTVHDPAMIRSGPVRDGLDRPVHFKPLVKDIFLKKIAITFFKYEVILIYGVK
jgi:hypothetical protein